MASGIEASAGRVAGQVALRAGRRVLENRRRQHLADEARTLIPTRNADRIVGELEAGHAQALADFLASPDLEHLALQIVLALPSAARGSAAMTEIRHQVREGVRAGGIPSEQLTEVTDLVFDALLMACHSAMAEPGIGAGLENAFSVAAQSHLAAMGARNGRLLGGLSDLTEIRAAAGRLTEQVRALRSRIHLSHTGVSRSVPWSQLFVMPSLRPAHADSTDALVPPVEELVAPGRRSVLLGDPGGGKSTLAAKLAYDVATASRPRTPFLVVLRDIAETLRAGDRTFVDCLAMAGRAPYGVDLAADAIEYLIMNGRAVVLVDGLDELTDLALRGRVVETLNGFATLYPLVPMIVTSRQVGYAEAALDAGLFLSYVIAPFDEGRVEEYARRWFDLDDGTPVEDRASRCALFLQESDSISDLRSNPLMLSLLCAGYATERHLPKNRAQVYERCATTLFDRWDSMRGVPMPLRFHGHVRGAVVELAWQMLAVRDVALLSRPKVLAILRAHLVAKRVDEDEADVLAEGFLAFCAGRAWILTEVGTVDGEPAYGFAHRTFMEYFAAERLVRRNVGPAAVWHALAPRFGEPSWSVIAQLVLQLLDRNVDDGGEALVESALTERSGLDDERRFDLTAFLARAAGHLVLSRSTLDRIVEAAVADSRTIDTDARYAFWPNEDMHKRAARRDAPFRDLLYLSLDANLPDLRRSVEQRLGTAAEAGDDHALYLIHNLSRYNFSAEERTAFWSDLESELRARHARAFEAWWKRRPWGRLWGFYDDPTVIDDMVERFGVAPFYTGDLYAGGLTAPGVSILLNVGPPAERQPGVTMNARALRDHLLTWPTPWLDGEQWWSQLARSDAEAALWMAQRLYTEWPDADELGTFVVLCLPWFESAEKLQSGQPLAAPAAALIGARRRYRKTGRLDPEELTAYPENCRALIEDWIRGRSVIGPSVT